MSPQEEDTQGLSGHDMYIIYSHKHIQGKSVIPLKSPLTFLYFSPHFIPSLVSLRHGLVDRLHSVSHSKFVHDLLSRLLKIDFPGIVSFSLRDLHHTAVLLLRSVVEEVLQTQTLPVRWWSKAAINTATCSERNPLVWIWIQRKMYRNGWRLTYNAQLAVVFTGLVSVGELLYTSGHCVWLAHGESKYTVVTWRCSTQDITSWHNNTLLVRVKCHGTTVSTRLPVKQLLFSSDYWYWHLYQNEWHIQYYTSSLPVSFSSN